MFSKSEKNGFPCFFGDRNLPPNKVHQENIVPNGNLPVCRLSQLPKATLRGDVVAYTAAPGASLGWMGLDVWGEVSTYQVGRYKTS